MEYSALMKDPRLQPLWTRGFGNECGRLFQGVRDIPGAYTCFFIKLTNIPKDRNITFGKIVCDYKHHKKEKERVRLTVGGDTLDYSGDVATSTADITTFKIKINRTLSTEDAAMMMMDIKNYYLGNPLTRFEYMKMLLSRFPEEIVQKYNLNELAVDGWVYIEIRKGMYGLKQAGLLDNQLLQTRLAPFGYYPARHTPGLWLHNTRPISFILVVDDFAILYYARAVDPTVLMPLNDIATKQTTATEKTQAATNQLLDYLATHPDAAIRYHASDMILHIHSDASYLSVSNARRRLGGLFFLGNKSPE
jgi:hypothetical protein